MRTRFCTSLLAVFALAACDRTPGPASTPGSLTAASAAHVADSVRAFMQAVAHGVTQDGPMGWRKYFADTAAFFMAVDGQMVFATSEAATAGIQQVSRELKRVELAWGDDLRIDPLTPDLAVVASPYHELQMHADGKRSEEAGFFTGVAERRQAGWQLRDAHWSAAAPAAGH